MKRIFVFAAALISASSAFAFGSGLGGGADVIGLIMLIFGILNIILFFKIWGMTNDINALKKDHFKEQVLTADDMAKRIRKQIVLGNKEEVKRILLQNFVDDIEQYKVKSYNTIYYKTNKKDVAEEMSLQLSIKAYIENLKRQYTIIGEELPYSIVRLETIGDFISLFKTEDLFMKEEKKE